MVQRFNVLITRNTTMSRQSNAEIKCTFSYSKLLSTLVPWSPVPRPPPCVMSFLNLLAFAGTVVVDVYFYWFDGIGSKRYTLETIYQTYPTR